jgi:hypothetical protein
MRRRHDRRQAKAVEFAQRELIHHAGLAQSLGRGVDDFKNR